MDGTEGQLFGSGNDERGRQLSSQLCLCWLAGMSCIRRVRHSASAQHRRWHPCTVRVGSDGCMDRGNGQHQANVGERSRGQVEGRSMRAHADGEEAVLEDDHAHVLVAIFIIANYNPIFALLPGPFGVTILMTASTRLYIDLIQTTRPMPA